MSPHAFAPRAAVLTCACALAGIAAPAAGAQPVLQVAPGESLWQIAAANGLSPAALAAANGLPADTAVLAGQVVRIPPAGDAQGAAATTGAGAATAGGPAPSTATGSGAAGASASPATASAPTGGSAGSVVVRPGDTLSAIAERAGVSVTRLAAANGVNASALLPAGRALSLPQPGTAVAQGASPASGTASSGTGATTTPAGMGTTTTTTAPAAATTTTVQATTPATSASSPGGTRVTAAEVGAAATANGVPASLARAIAWQESGFDNGAVSSVGARGAMQVMPDTLTWINGTLSSRRLDSSSAVDNVQAGTLYLQHLLRETGGDADQAAAAYYQGLSSVRARGMYDDTRRYVENVRALRSRFGG